MNCSTEASAKKREVVLKLKLGTPLNTPLIESDIVWKPNEWNFHNSCLQRASLAYPFLYIIHSTQSLISLSDTQRASYPSQIHREPHIPLWYIESLMSLSVYPTFYREPHIPLWYTESLISLFVSYPSQIYREPHIPLWYTESLISLSVYHTYNREPHNPLTYTESLQPFSHTRLSVDMSCGKCIHNSYQRGIWDYPTNVSAPNRHRVVTGSCTINWILTTLGSCAINWVLTAHVVQWLSCVFATEEQKKGRMGREKEEQKSACLNNRVLYFHVSTFMSSRHSTPLHHVCESPCQQYRNCWHPDLLQKSPIQLWLFSKN